MIGTGQEHTNEPDAGVGLDDGGYILVAVLVGMAITAVWMGSLLPSWHHLSVREKEADLIYRGEQYARAIELYRRRTGQMPTSIDVLVNQHYLRKKYLDPMTGKDFVPVVGGTVPGQGLGGITGVRSTSTERSIRVYRNQSVYSLFPFDFLVEQEKSGTGAPAPGTSGPGRPGGPGGGRQQGPARGGPARPGGPGGARGGQQPGGNRGAPLPDEVAPIGPGGGLRQGGPARGGG